MCGYGGFFIMVFSSRLHVKLKEEDEACKQYTRFVAQAETTGVSDGI